MMRRETKLLRYRRSIDDGLDFELCAGIRRVPLHLDDDSR